MVKNIKKYNGLNHQAFFYKNLAIFTIKHDLKLIEQRIWDAMLIFAHDNLLKEDSHKISLATLSNLLSIKNQSFICERINNLKKRINQEQASLMFYFEDVKITQNSIIYKYPEHLRILNANKPEHEILKKTLSINFKSKYSLVFYKFCLYWNIFAHLNTVSILGLRNYLGVDAAKYDNTKNFIDFILIKAIYEINEKTDLYVNFKRIKIGAQVIAINLEVKNTNQFEITPEELSDFILFNFAFFKAFTLYDDDKNLRIGKFFIDKYISSCEKEFFTCSLKLKEMCRD